MELLLFTEQLISSQEQGGTERRKAGLFSVTRRLDRSKDPQPLKSYLDLVCSRIHRPREDSLHVDLETESPTQRFLEVKREISYLS